MLWLNDLFNAWIITNHNSLLVTVLFAQQFYKREVFSSNLQSSSVKFFQVKKERSHVWPLNSNRTYSAAWHLSCRSWICCCHFSSSSLAFCSVCGWTNYSYRVSLERSTHIHIIYTSVYRSEHKSTPLLYALSRPRFNSSEVLLVLFSSCPMKIVRGRAHDNHGILGPGPGP